MVVNRRISVSAAPPISRTSSTQPASRVTKAPFVPSPLSETSHSSMAKIKTSRSKERKERNAYGFLKLLIFGLSAFAIYTIALCRTDFPRTSPTCQSLDLYRAHIVDPYFVPLVQHAQPYAAPLKPYATSAAAFISTHITPRIYGAFNTASSYYRTYVAPWLHWVIDQAWNGLIKPIYFDYIHPRLERHTRPHRFYYHKVLVPGACKGTAYVQTTYARFLPHARYYLGKVQKRAADVYETARPHVLEAYQRVRPHAVVLLNQTQIQALGLARKAGDVRREFVDPHVRKIIDTVVEKSASPPAHTQPREDEPSDSIIT